MTSPQRADRNAEPAVAGLRERKKARTRQTIQREAMRLFTAQGYESTTIEQIADAAEVSPSTFFRYFPTKEDVVVQDDFDPFRSALAAIPGEELDGILFRTRLANSVPALRARMLESLFTTADLLAAAVAEQSGRDPRSPAVRTLAGAVLGAMLPAMATWLSGDDAASLPAVVDESLGYLEAGLPI
jgi:AcrR family transcriptional regulator